MEKNYSNNNRAKAPEVLRPTEFIPYFICRIFCSFIILAYKYIHRSFTYFMKVTLPPSTSYETQHNTQAVTLPPYISYELQCNEQES
jgi:hypothetical protein